MNLIIKKMIPRQLMYALRSLRISVARFGLVVFSKNRKLSDFYYFISSGFSREHQAVLQGRQAYHASLKNIGVSCALLRRNIHRLEKGLIMRPRRSVFAEGFISETVKCYGDATSSERLDYAEKKWATDVLDEYFSVVGSSKIIDEAKERYLLLTKEYVIESEQNGLPPVEGAFKPYQYDRIRKSNISFGELKQLYIQRRSVRWYQDKEIPYELVEEAVNIASFAPSACNRQPYRFVFCNDKIKSVRIAKCAGGTTGFADNLRSIIVVVGDLSAYPYERDRHLIYIDGSLAAMQLMLALETQGLSTCPINWPEVELSERKIREIVKLKNYERVVMLLAVGYADLSGGVPYSQKKMNALILEDITHDY